jgi:hypothetical protein
MCGGESMSEPQYLDGDDTARGIDKDEDEDQEEEGNDSYDTLQEMEGLN